MSSSYCKNIRWWDSSEFVRVNGFINGGERGSRPVGEREGADKREEGREQTRGRKGGSRQEGGREGADVRREGADKWKCEGVSETLLCPAVVIS